ncbi:unnamed protein product [Alopecurus aequalis]
MGLLLFPSGATVSGPLLPTYPLRRAGAATFRPSSSSGNVEATTDTTSSMAKNGQEWRSAGVGQAPFGLGLNLSEEMRRDMMWRMLAFPAAAVAAEAVFLAVLNSGAGPAADAPAWAGKAGSAVLFAAGLLGSQYGFFSSRWDAAEEEGGCELAVRHWNVLSVARDSSVEEDDDEEEEEEDDDDEWEYYDDDKEEDDD